MIIRLLPVLVSLLLLVTFTSSEGQNVRSPCPYAIKINTNYQFRGSLHFICLQSTNSRPRLDVIQYNTQQVILSKEVDDFGTNQLSSFVDDEGTLRILLAVPNKFNGTSVYSIDRQAKFIEETHTINTQFVSAMNIWRLELNWEWQLAIANQPTYEPLMLERAASQSRAPLPDPRPIISFHSWRSTYFDSYQLLHLPQDGRVNKLEPMHINGQEFLIVAMESNKLDHSLNGRLVEPTDSLIYKLDFGDGTLNWVHFQHLQTSLAMDVKSFAVTHQGSSHMDFYIALLGQARINPEQQLANEQNRTGEEHGLIIYKYMGDRFISNHSIPVPGATKLDAISYGRGDSYVIIALLSEYLKQIDLFVFDGLTLKNIPSPTVNRAPLNKHFSRYRRTMDTANVHLFLMPPTPQNESNATVKRTLTEFQLEGLTLPAVAFSTSFMTPNQLDNDSDSSEAVYQIAVDKVIKDKTLEQSNENAGYSKRNLLGAGEDLLEWCKKTIDTLFSDNFSSLSKQLLTLPRIDQQRPIEIAGDLIVDNDLYISNLLYVNRVEARTQVQNVILEETPTNYSYTFAQIQQVHFEIDRVKRQVDQILVDDGTSQDIFTPLRFDTLVLECLNPANSDPRLRHVPYMGTSCPHVDEIQTIFLNSKDIRNIRAQALITGRSMTISSDVRFEHLVLRGSTEILETLNGIPISEIVFKRGPSTGPIIGTKKFLIGLFSSSDLLLDTWNGFHIDRLNYLTSSGEQRVDVDLQINRVIIDSTQQNHLNVSSRIENLNGLELSMHLDQIAQSDSDNTFQVPLQIDELLLNGPVQFTPNSRLSTIDIENLWYNTMFKQSNQNITAPLIFSNVHVSYGGDIHVDGHVNGLILNSGNVLMKNKDYSLPNPVVFENDLYVRELELKTGLNGIQVAPNTNGRPELAVLLNKGTQILSGEKVLDEVYLGGYSTINGNINGHLNLTQLYTLANNNGEPYRFSTIRLTGHDIRVADRGHLHIDATINGIPTNDICSLAERITREPYIKYDRLRFDQPVNLRTLRCAAINGFNNLPGFFLTKHGNQHVAGTLRLVSGLVFNTTLNIRSTINDMNVAPLGVAISQAVNESRTGHKEIYGDFVVDDLITDRINSLRLSNVFLARSDEPQVVRAPLIFDHLDIENVLTIGHNLVTSSFNGLNVTDIMSNTLQYDTPQVIYNHLELQTLQLLHNSNFLTKSLNGIDIRKLYGDAVLVDVPQQILAPKLFTGSVGFMDQVSLRHSISGLSDHELRFNLLLHGDELIDDDLEFNNDLVVRKELEIQNGIINDIDIKSFVDSMLYEGKPNRGALRIIGNGSVRFKDVRVKNLVVAGTIQGVDLSREAINRIENVNGTYDSDLGEQQALSNNRRLINLYEPGSTFNVFSNYRGLNHTGICHVHSCARTPIPVHVTSPMSQQANYQTTPLPNSYRQLSYPLPYTGPRVNQSAPLLRPVTHTQAPVYMQQFYPNVLPRPMNLIRLPVMNTTWQPNWSSINRVQYGFNFTQDNSNLEPTALVDLKYMEYQSMIQAQAVRDLASRVNKYLSISFYYEIIQKHPLLGPLLSAASNPIPNEEGRSLLLLKGTSEDGEPCLQRGQTIAIMAQQRQRSAMSAFTQSSRIQETSNPSVVRSIVVGQSHYLFILDTYSEANVKTMSQIMIYLWDYKSAMYNLRERIPIDGYPTAMKPIEVNGIVCIAVANPKVKRNNTSGIPVLYCQQSPTSEFNRQLFIGLANVFDLDIVTRHKSSQIIVAALSQQDTEQIGDLNVIAYDIISGKIIRSIALRRMVKPLKLHFFMNPAKPMITNLVVSEAITSSDNAQATTRIFALESLPGYFGHIYNHTSLFYESQVIKDNQIYDIQSVLLDNMNSMLFLQSVNSISIYAPPVAINTQDCGAQYSLIQRLPTKGANKFLVFNDHYNTGNLTHIGPYGHFLVLSKDDCEQQKFSTVILRARFR